MKELTVIDQKKQKSGVQTDTFAYNPQVIGGLMLDSDKLMYHKDRVEAWQRGERIAPITIDMALTRACNAKCTFCYAMLQENVLRSFEGDTERWTKDVIFKFLDDAAEIGVRGISFVSDGESTINPYFYDAVIRGKKNGIDMASGTNGTLLKEERLEEMLEALTYLRFNISGGTREGYARIMGLKEEHLEVVCDNIRKCVQIKRRANLPVTIGMQMVLEPQEADEIAPLADLGKELGVDYFVIKHCSDDEMGSLGVNYRAYERVEDKIRAAEQKSTEGYKVIAKWSKIKSDGKRVYQRCYGPPFILQMSGSGLVAPCGMLFEERYKDGFHIGDIFKQSFKEIYQSDKYWQVMRFLSSKAFNAQKECGALCLQHKVNERLYHLVEHGKPLPEPNGEKPLHINFI